MAYAVIADVQALNQQRTYDSSSKPTSAQVTQFIADVSGELDGVLDALGYSTPIPSTATKATVIIKNITVFGAAAKAEWAAYSIGGAGDSARAELLGKEYDRRLVMLYKGQTTLLDATEGADTPAQQHEQTPIATFNEDSTGTERDRTFTRDMNF